LISERELTVLKVIEWRHCVKEKGLQAQDTMMVTRKACSSAHCAPTGAPPM
jgi:hypothetical protein